MRFSMNNSDIQGPATFKLRPASVLMVGQVVGPALARPYRKKIILKQNKITRIHRKCNYQ